MKIKQFFKTIPAVLALAFAGPAAAKDSGPLDVYWVDVEGGAATLVVTPAGESLLVDTGNPGTRDAGRIGVNVILYSMIQDAGQRQRFEDLRRVSLLRRSLFARNR